MAFSAALSTSFYTPQSSLFSPEKSNKLFLKTNSLLFPSQAEKRNLYQPLRYNKGFSPERCVGIVKAIKFDKGFKNVEVFTKEHVAVSLAHDVAQHSSKFIRERGAFTVVLSGGSLIKYLRKLVESPHAESIDWSKWHIFWVDERVVPRDHLESNYKLAYDGFLSKVPIPALNIYGIDDALEADGAADVYETTLRRLVKSGVIKTSATGFPKFDLMLLGMGPDGHVASLFPEHPLLKEDKKWVTFIKDSPKPPSDRITLTFPVINSSSNIAMVVTGAGKSSAVFSTLQDDENTEKLPAGLVSPEGGLKWYLDIGAASKLFKE